MRPEFWLRIKKVFTGYPYLYRKHLVTNYGTRFTKPNPDVPANVPTCPFCGHALKLADEKLPLESLVEHVFEPNGTATYKFVVVCSNDECMMGKFFMYNYYSGEVYRRNDVYFEYFFKQGPDGKPDIHSYRSDEHNRWTNRNSASDRDYGRQSNHRSQPSIRRRGPAFHR